MVLINGKYQLVKSENFLECMIARGVPEEKAKEFMKGRKDLEIILEGSKLLLKYDELRSEEFILGEEVDSQIRPDVKVTNLATIEGNVLSIISKHPDNSTGKRVSEFSEDGFVLTVTSSKPGVPQATLTYKRV